MKILVVTRADQVGPGDQVVVLDGAGLTRAMRVNPHTRSHGDRSLLLVLDSHEVELRPEELVVKAGPWFS